ncbi:MAG: hypothetical protein AAF492_13075, partial [Verrucomicrobiota bacterium]
LARYIKHLEPVKAESIRSEDVDGARKAAKELDRAKENYRSIRAGLTKNEPPAPPAPRPTKILPARLEVKSGFTSIKPLRNRQAAYSNRKYVWMNIPDDFPFSQFAMVPGGGTAPIKGSVTTSGWLYAAINEEADASRLKNLAEKGWEKTTMEFAYSAGGGTKMVVYKKRMRRGPFTLPRMHWSGPVLLLP